MKLLSKATLTYLLITLVVFGFGGILTYNIFRAQVVQETDYYLWQEVRLLAKSIERGAPVEALNHEYQTIERWEGANPDSVTYAFRDTLVWHRYSKSMEPYRKIVTLRQVHEDWYRFTLVNSIVEPQDIYDSVFASLSRMFALLVVVVGICTFFISIWLFRPFRETLQAIQSYRLPNSEPLNLAPTKTKEFTELNLFISQMTSKIHHDYLSLKEFAENASHEMQTPLAIAKGKLELLMESQSLNEEQSQLIQSAYLSISKLSKLGRSLALLTRIENQEFTDFRLLNVSQTLEETLFGFQELIELRGLTLEEKILDEVQVHTDPILVDILLNNLFQNAIRHNQESGKIALSLNKEAFTIRNTGAPPTHDPTALFDRFRKGRNSSESLGLGLAIVKKICEVNQWTISYEYEDGWHELKVSW